MHIENKCENVTLMCFPLVKPDFLSLLECMDDVSRNKVLFQKVITIVANPNAEDLSEETPVLVTVTEDGTELPVEGEIVEEAEGG